MKFHRLTLLSILFAFAGAPLFGQDLAGFFKAHCFECHNDATREAGLSLQSLPQDFSSHDRHRAWIRIHDQLAGNKMPPKEHAQPAMKDRLAIVAKLRGELHKASLEHQRVDGRAPLRRLNRTEYEYTMHDLLGVFGQLKDMLPDDSTVAGFDTVGEGLVVSPTHLVRYQQAADKAIHESFPWRPDPKQLTDERLGISGGKNRRTPAEQAKIPHHAVVLERTAIRRGESFAYLANDTKHLSLRTADTMRPGRYKIRASVAAEDSDGEPIHVYFAYVDKSVPEEKRNEHILSVQDLPANSRRVVEFEATFPDDRNRVHIWGWNLPYYTSAEFRKQRGELPIGKVQGKKLIVDWIEIEGPLDSWPSVGYRRMFGKMPLTSRRIESGQHTLELKLKQHPNEWINDPFIPKTKTPKEDAERLIGDFLPIAFRRPVPDPSLVDYYVRFAHKRIDEGLEFGAAMRATYRAVLCSPFFLHRIEKAGPLDDHAIASRLSYFLWSSMPDDELLKLAGNGKLRDRNVLGQQVERLLKDKKSDRFVKNFTDQWLDLRKIHMTTPNRKYYGEWDQKLLWSMPQETVLFFKEILNHDRSLLEFIDSDWSMLNERLARHYAIGGVKGMEFRKVKLPADAHRGGLMTQAIILKITADGTRTSPILRGAWVLDKLIGKPPSPPPPNLPSIEPDIRGATTIRQQLEKHRNTEVCATCHRHIDPPGFALETFDVIGGWRDRYRSTTGGPGKDYVNLVRYPNVKTWKALPVEKGYVTEDGREFAGIDEYKIILLDDKDQIARNLAEKLVIYSTGADIAFADRQVIDEIVANVRKKNYGFRSLIHEVVQSRLFLNK